MMIEPIQTQVQAESQLSGEARLAAAVIKQAILDARGKAYGVGRREKQTISEEAEQWLLDEHNPEFERWADVLGVTTEALRYIALRQLRKKGQRMAAYRAGVL